MKRFLFLSWLLTTAGLAAQAQTNPAGPGQSPLRRLSPPPGQSRPGVSGPAAPPGTGRGLDSLRTLSGRYKALTPAAPSLVLFDVTAGLSHPLGGFADSPTEGAATNGGTLSVGAAYLFNHYLGVFGSLSGGYHGVREEAIGSRLNLTDQNATGITYGIAGWSHVAFVLGPQLTLPLGTPKRLALDLRPGLGLVYVVSPRYGATFIDPATGNQQHKAVSSAAAFAPTFQLGASLRVPFSERLGLRLGADYFYARPSFNNYDPGTTIILVDSFTRRTVSFVQLSVGVVVRFE